MLNERGARLKYILAHASVATSSLTWCALHGIDSLTPWLRLMFATICFGHMALSAGAPHYMHRSPSDFLFFMIDRFISFSFVVAHPTGWVSEVAFAIMELHCVLQTPASFRASLFVWTVGRIATLPLLAFHAPHTTLAHIIVLWIASLPRAMFGFGLWRDERIRWKGRPRGVVLSGALFLAPLIFHPEISNNVFATGAYFVLAAGRIVGTGAPAQSVWSSLGRAWTSAFILCAIAERILPLATQVVDSDNIIIVSICIVAGSLLPQQLVVGAGLGVACAFHPVLLFPCVFIALRTSISQEETACGIWIRDATWAALLLISRPFADESLVVV